MAAEEGRAAIWEVDPKSGQHRVFASGIRNPNGMAWRTDGGTPTLWTVANERDEIGSDLVPDYLTSVRDGGFYGWPYSYYGSHVDERVQPPRPDLVAKAIVPDYALGPHTASLGLSQLGRRQAAAGVRRRHVRRPAWLVEPQAAQRLQGDLRAVQRRQAVRPAGRRAERLPQPRWRRLGPAGRGGDRQARRPAGGRRRRQRDLARLRPGLDGDRAAAGGRRRPQRHRLRRPHRRRSPRRLNRRPAASTAANASPPSAVPSTTASPSAIDAPASAPPTGGSDAQPRAPGTATQ